MSDRIIIKNGTVVTMNDADDVIFGGSVVIEDDTIKTKPELGIELIERKGDDANRHQADAQRMPA